MNAYDEEDFNWNDDSKPFAKYTPEEFYAVLCEHEIDYKEREIPVKLIFNEINIKVITLLKFLNKTKGYDRIKTNRELEFIQAYNEYCDFHNPVEIFNYFKEDDIKTLTMDISDWNNWKQIHCISKKKTYSFDKSDTDKEIVTDEYLEIKAEFERCSECPIVDELNHLRDELVTYKNQLNELKARIENEKKSYIEGNGLCTTVIKMRKNGDSDKKIAKHLESQYGISKAMIGALLYHVTDGIVSSEAIRKYGVRMCDGEEC